MNNEIPVSLKSLKPVSNKIFQLSESKTTVNSTFSLLEGQEITSANIPTHKQDTCQEYCSNGTIIMDSKMCSICLMFWASPKVSATNAVCLGYTLQGPHMVPPNYSWVMEMLTISFLKVRSVTFLANTLQKCFPGFQPGKESQ